MIEKQQDPQLRTRTSIWKKAQISTFERLTRIFDACEF